MASAADRIFGNVVLRRKRTGNAVVVAAPGRDVLADAGKANNARHVGRQRSYGSFVAVDADEVGPEVDGFGNGAEGGNDVVGDGDRF